VGGVVDLSSKSKEKKEKVKLNIDDVNDVEVLNKMMSESNSRGKKQRIKKKIEKLSGVAQPTTVTPK